MMERILFRALASTIMELRKYTGMEVVDSILYNAVREEMEDYTPDTQIAETEIVVTGLNEYMEYDADKYKTKKLFVCAED